MKMNAELLKKLAKGATIAVGTGLGLLLSSMITTKEDPDEESIEGECEVTDADPEIEVTVEE